MRADFSDGRKYKGRKQLQKYPNKSKSSAPSNLVTGSSKLSMVLHQVASRKCHMAGLQELSAFDTGICVMDGFVICRSAADSQAAHGCGLVFNTKTPWFDIGDRKVFVSRQDVAIELAEPRFLCVGVSTEACEWLCVSTHGPLQTSSDTTYADFWDRVSLWITKHARGRPVIMCADGNATLAHAVDHCVGPNLSRKSLPASEALVGCIDKCRLWAPASYFEYADTCVSTSCLQCSQG